MDCRLIAHEDIAERYLLGKLSPEQETAYEQHFFECDGCFADLQHMRAVRDALQFAPTEAPQRRRAFGHVGEWWRWPAIAAVAAVSAVGVALLLRRHETVLPPPFPESNPLAATGEATSSPGLVPDASQQEVPAGIAPPADDAPARATPAPATEGRSAIIARLAAVQPPRYDPPVLRGMHDAASTAFREAMKSYVAGDYRSAVSVLQRAAAADPARPDIAFYLGAAELLAGWPEPARLEFERLLAMGETVFTDEAHFYLGKTLLRLGRLADAQQEFLLVTQVDGPQQAEAKTVLEALAQLEPTPVPR